MRTNRKNAGKLKGWASPYAMPLVTEAPQLVDSQDPERATKERILRLGGPAVTGM